MPTTLTLVLIVAIAFAVGFNLWFLFEYLLHRFAMHHLHGKGIMSREHLEHHVKATWRIEFTTILSWLGVAIVGGAVWFPLGYLLGGVAAGLALSAGWACSYAFYEYQHAVSHLRAPKTEYQRWVRKNHFHHHFGKPMTNHGVSLGLWDRVFGTQENPGIIKIPRRMAAGLGWIIDDNGDLHPEFAEDYELVGTYDTTERQDQIDRAKAFASSAPDA